MAMKLQAVRIKLKDGREYRFVGPVVFDESQESHGIEAIHFSNHFECEEAISLRDLYLLMQTDGSVH
ncbi:MAG: hypothetical protein OEQ18_00465 [Gammaproteobacteria bacterium]|nr:hypothetical protein [Gammaproteobacteria bacterium]